MDNAVKDRFIRSQLQERRRSLATALDQFGQPEHLVRLLQEVDAALERMNQGTYGLCERCHDSIETDRLLADPLLTTCLDHLTPEQQRSLEEDLDLAAKIQRKLLPPQSFNSRLWEIYYHYEPAGAVSGDYCDLIGPEAESGSFCLLLGDVSGKGVAASMLMAHLHALFRGLISAGTPLKQLAGKANRIFCESTISTHYATLILARADQSGQVEICNGGHCQPLWIRGSEVLAIEATDLPIGMFCDLEYSSRKIHLQPGDSLLLYTDGLTESRNQAGEEYGLARLSRWAGEHHQLAPQAMIKACLQDLRTFRAATPGLDDLTIMAIRRAG